MQSAPDLELDAVERRDDGIRAEITIDAPLSGNDDLLTHTFLLRIADAKEGVPETVIVDIDGYP